ncbi:hypothetical protein Mapa_000198 [Marchantia paleacea]|nr:hypothetical protein Mapa_000198 [Marchantia paleacea]
MRLYRTDAIESIQSFYRVFRIPMAMTRCMRVSRLRSLFSTLSLCFRQNMSSFASQHLMHPHEVSDRTPDEIVRAPRPERNGHVVIELCRKVHCDRRPVIAKWPPIP